MKLFASSTVIWDGPAILWMMMGWGVVCMTPRGLHRHKYRRQHVQRSRRHCRTSDLPLGPPLTPPRAFLPRILSKVDLRPSHLAAYTSSSSLLLPILLSSSGHLFFFSTLILLSRNTLWFISQDPTSLYTARLNLLIVTSAKFTTW